eukprot:SAG31_NODE_1127_length_9758_cov_2.771301_4_plen_215_part_00
MNTLWEASSANHLPSLTFLPTFTATAWYHKVLAPSFQALSLRAALDEAEAWTLDVYAPALAKGVTRLSIDERMVIIEGLVKYTGVSRAFAEASNLEIDDGAYRKELLRSARRTVGRLDSRYIGAVLKSDSPHLRHVAVPKCTDAIDFGYPTTRRDRSQRHRWAVGVRPVKRRDDPGLRRLLQRLRRARAQVQVRSYFFVFVPTIREIRDFYREM